MVSGIIKSIFKKREKPNVIKMMFKKQAKGQVRRLIKEKRLEFVDKDTIRYTDRMGATKIYSFQRFATTMVAAFVARTENDETVKKASSSFGMSVAALSTQGLSDDTFREALDEVYKETKKK